MQAALLGLLKSTFLQVSFLYVEMEDRTHIC